MAVYTIHYTGRVQGVGFRATCQHLSRPFPSLGGEVANLAQGGVELIVQGEQKEIDEYLASIARHFAANIDRVYKVAGATREIDETRPGICIGRDVW